MTEIRYPELYSVLTTNNIVDYLNTRPELIDTWVYYSEDIRHNPAWGLYQDKKGIWTVDYLDSKNSIRNKFVYADKFGACTKMIIETFESIRKNNS